VVPRPQIEGKNIMSAPLSLRLRPLACFVSGLFVFTAAQAQDSAPAAAEEEVLEEVIVTAVARPVNRLESSISTSALNIDALNEIAPRSVAEVFRALPGIRSESSGGNGNANITIRGIPLATGGAKYLQLHEDGLPVVEFGDMNFANADNFIRYDGSVARIESVRGGSASTFASNSPGGIINMISNYGEREGGNVGVSFGLDYDELRTDFAYGGALTDTIDYHIGGFYRTGEGVRETGFDGDKGGQVKFNLTKKFDDGFIRFYAKRLDDRVTTYLPSPVLVKSNGDFGPVPGYDASTESLHSPFQTTVSTFNAFGDRVQRDITDGIHSKVSSFGFELNYEVAEGWTVNNKFRTSNVSGSWISPFTDGVGSAGALADGVCAGSPNNGMGTAISGCTGITNIRLGSGANAGTLVPRTALAFQNLLFDVTFNDVGNLINDLKITKEIGPAAITLGYYKSKQSIDIDWNSWPFYLQTVAGGASQGLNVVSTTGAQVTDDGLWWPGLLSWTWDLEYDTTAPYLSVAFDFDQFNFDVSVRRDDVEARGQRSAVCCGGSGGNGIVVDIDNNGQIDFWEARGVAVANNRQALNLVNYDADNTSFSIGGTWLFRDDMSVFARYSEGGRAIADRLLQIDGAILANGSLSPTFDGFDNVDQLEVGYKFKSGPLALYATFFNTTTEETNAEITSGATFVREYEANGLELEGAYSVGLFKINGNITWTDAEIKKDRTNAAVVGNKPRRQADLIYTLSPSFGSDRWSVGATFQGSTDYYLQDSNQLQQDGYVIVHAFGSYNITDALSVRFNVNNLTDEFVLTESEEGSIPAPIAGIGSVVRGRPLSGRSTMLSVRYEF
jgi:outer membrane receptor protein involved in Fe transport